MAFPTFKNRDLHDFLKNQSLPFSNNASKESLFNYIKNKLLENSRFEFTTKFEEILQSKISNFCSHLWSKWQGTGVRRIKSKFLQKYTTWLDAPFSLSELQEIKSRSSTKDVGGRPKKRFADASNKTKRRRVEELKNNISTEEIIFAAKISLYDEGKRAAADLLSQCTEHSSSQSIKFKIKNFKS